MIRHTFILIFLFLSLGIASGQSLPTRQEIAQDFRVRERSLERIGLIWARPDSADGVLLTSLFRNVLDKQLAIVSDIHDPLNASGPKMQRIHSNWNDRLCKSSFTTLNTASISLCDEEEVFSQLRDLYNQDYRFFCTHLMGFGSIAELLESRLPCMVTSAELDGVSCLAATISTNDRSHVRVYVDPTRGSLLLRSELLLDRIPIRVFEAESFIQLENGCWFPLEWTQTFYESRIALLNSQTPDPNSMKAYSMTFSVISATTEPEAFPQESLFPPGCGVKDEVAGENYVEGNGERVLELSDAEYPQHLMLKSDQLSFDNARALGQASVSKQKVDDSLFVVPD